MDAFFVRAAGGTQASIFLNNGFAAIGWLNEPLLDSEQKSNITELYKKQFPKDSNGTMYQNVGQIFRFWNSIKIGDIVITTDLSNRLFFGLVTNKPYFKKDDLTSFSERIPVNWLPKSFDRESLSIPAQNSIKSSLTVFKVKQVKEIAVLAGFEMPYEPIDIISKPTYLQTDEIYNAIKSQLLQLDDAEFENFVAFILQSLGFEAQQRIGKVGDGGIDFEGVLDVYGIASAKLQVQVKRYANTPIGEKDIRNFRGALKRGHQGTFITLSAFQKKARESAEDKEKELINLVDGKRLVEIFILQFEKVMDLIEEAEETEMLQKLKFRRTIVPE